jgi:hypothetical protein
LSEDGYIGRTEPVLFLGEAGTGKTHLAIGLPDITIKEFASRSRSVPMLRHLDARIATAGC